MVGVCVCVRVSMQARGERGVYVMMLCAAYACVGDRVRACACGCLVHAYMCICMVERMHARMCDVMLVRACMRTSRYAYWMMCTE